MTAHVPTYKMEKKFSCDKYFDDISPPFHMFKIPSDEPHFYSQQRIQIKPFLTRLNLKDNKGNHEPGYGKSKHDLISIQDESQRLDYSGSGDMLSQTLINLGMRKGHSFEKQKIDFSLSSEAIDTEHQNLHLRKKLAQMKKELAFYRQHDESIFQQKLKVMAKGEKAQNQVHSLRQQLDNAKKRIAELQEQQIGNVQRIEQLQRVIAMTPKKRKTVHNFNEDMENQIQNYKAVVNNHEHQTEKIKEHYERELFENSSKFRKLIEQMTEQFQNAKTIGQNQINELIGKLQEKDHQIMLLKKMLASGKGASNKVSTFLSDQVVDKSNKIKSPSLDNSAHRYMNRFIQFSQFIDQRIHKSLQKDKLPPRQRISKSVIDKEPMVPKHLKQLTITIPESPESPDEKNLVNRFKISQLLQKNQRLRTPPNYPYRSHF